MFNTFGGFLGDDRRPMGRNRSAQFEATYRCFSVSVLLGSNRSDVERGGKIMMPPSALDQLTRLNIQYPMLFKLRNPNQGKETHCGVLEFVADEGRIYLPYWMMKNLYLDEGDIVDLRSVSLPVASFSKFQPQSPDFLDISNPKAVLEQTLRGFACLTQGDVVAITYNNKVYEICVLETKPGTAVSIIECDMKVDFAPPVGYQEPKPVPLPSGNDEVDHHEPVMPEENSFRAFNCRGNRLDGKSKNTERAPMDTSQTPARRGVPNYNFNKYKITFIRKIKLKAPSAEGEEDADDNFKAFEGAGFQLRPKRR